MVQAFRNAALVLKTDLKIYGADMSGTAPALAYCDETRQVVAIKDEGLANSKGCQRLKETKGNTG